TLSSFAGGRGVVGAVEGQLLRLKEPKWFDGARETWAHSADYDGTYVIGVTGHLWWRRFTIRYEYEAYVGSRRTHDRKLAEFKAQTEAKNYVETVWRMQAGGAFNPKGVE